MVPRLDRALGVTTLVARPQHVVDCGREFHREQAQPVKRVDEWLSEAFAIAEGRSILLPEVGHLQAFLHYVRSIVADRDASIASLLRDRET